MKKIRKFLIIMLVFVMTLTMFSGCGKNSEKVQSANKSVPALGNLKYKSSLKLQYAKCFSVDYYEDGYVLLTNGKTEKFLIVPENMKAPSGIGSDITVLKRPFTGLYVANTPSLSLINSMGALDLVKFTGTNVKQWYVKDIVNAMKSGKLSFGGKYNTPDYENLTAAKCNLAIESTMIESAPDVKDKLKELGIPVLIDHSGEESHPLGRVEWVKFYAALLGVDMSKANKVFDAQVAVVDKLSKNQSTGKTAAIFYISSKGTLYVRNTDDYLTKMLGLAGGKYICYKLKNSGTNSTTMEMETFYTQAKDADYIIYIYSLGGEPKTLADLVAKNKLLADFKAVKEGNVWVTGPEFFQTADVIGNMIGDIHTMLTTDDASVTKLSYLSKLQ